MDDRYLFRAKSCIGKWVYGLLKKQLVGEEPDAWAIQSYAGCPVANESGYSGQMRLYENVVDPATIGQCTGMRDGNGRLIFEGDIIYVDEWEGKFAVVWRWRGWYLNTPDNYEPLSDVEDVGDFEIVGNIHDEE